MTAIKVLLPDTLINHSIFQFPWSLAISVFIHEVRERKMETERETGITSVVPETEQARVVHRITEKER